MKQATISGLKKKLLLVELPEGIEKVGIKAYLSEVLEDTYLGNYVLIGKLTDIKEEMFEQWVEYAEMPILYEDEESFQFKNYQFKKLSDKYSLTAKESFFSKLEADGIYFENILVNIEGVWDDEEFKQFEEKVWDINRTYLFLII